MRWAAGPAALVVAEDLFNKDPDGSSVIDLLRALESSAADAGGKVVVTLGNHEAEFLVNPRNNKAAAEDGLTTQLPALGWQNNRVMARESALNAAASRVRRSFFLFPG